MKRKLGAVLLVVALALALAVPAAAHTEVNPFTTDLLAGQDIPVGTVSVWNDASDLHVTYNITLAPWVITETHVDVQPSLGAIPQTGSGNPKVGKFAYKSEHAFPGVTTYTETIPLNGWEPGDRLYIAAHAEVVIFDMIEEVVVDEETAWADGCDFPGRNWAMYFTYDIQDGNGGGGNG